MILKYKLAVKGLRKHWGEKFLLFIQVLLTVLENGPDFKVNRVCQRKQ